MQLPKCQQQPIQVSRKNFACRRNICEEKGETSSRAIKWPRGIESSWMDNRLDIKGGLSGVGLKTLYLIFHPPSEKTWLHNQMFTHVNDEQHEQMGKTTLTNHARVASASPLFRRSPTR